MTQQAMQRANAQIRAIHETFDERREQLIKVLPDDEAVERLVMSALMTVADNEKLRECRPISIFRSVAQCALLRLNIIAGEAFLVPFKGNCTLLPGYRGYQRIAQRAGFVITADIVGEADKFSFSKLPMRAEHVPNLGDRGERKGAYAAALVNGDLIAVEWAPEFEIQKAREQAKRRNNGKESPAWKAWPDRMARRFPLSRMCKDLPSENEALRELVRIDRDFDRGGRPDPVIDSVSDLEPVVEDKLAPGTHRFGFSPEWPQGDDQTEPAEEQPPPAEEPPPPDDYDDGMPPWDGGE